MFEGVSTLGVMVLVGMFLVIGSGAALIHYSSFRPHER